MRTKKLMNLLALGILVVNSIVSVNAAPTINTSHALSYKEVLAFNQGLEIVAENDTKILFLDEKSTMLRVWSKDSNQYVDTKVLESTAGNATMQNLQKADMNFFYMSNKGSDSKIAVSSMDNYSMSVALDSFEYESIKNGIRINYKVGETGITNNDFPQYISKERMEEYVGQYLNTTQKRQLTTVYYRLSQDTYARRGGENATLGKLAAKELYSYFYEIGKYTPQELEKDNLEHNIELKAAAQHIEASIEYILEGDDLVVRIPVSEMVTAEGYPLQSIDVLPYFMIGTKQDEGYMFVPDGSGALINLNNGKISEGIYSSRFYQGDVLINAETYKGNENRLNLPVFGIKNQDQAIVAIIEEGAEVATLNACVSEMMDEYNRMSLNFKIRDIENINAANTGNYTVAKYIEDAYTNDIVIRYRFLEGDKANYVGMAKVYQEYLLECNGLVQNEIEEDAPLYIELLGAIDKTKFFLGIPYNSEVPLTTFNQAREILKSINSKGILNLKLQYTGIANGGLNQTALNKLKISDKIGGQKGLKEFNTYVESIKAQLYPNLLIQTAITDKGLNNDMQPTFLSGKIAQIYNFDLVTRTILKNDKYPTHIIAGQRLAQYHDQFTKQYDKLGITGLSSYDLGTFIAGDYKRNANISMTHSKHYYDQALMNLGNKYSLMLSNPMDYAYKYVDYITDLPVESSGNKLFDLDIPFIQMVLEGYINYSMPVVNSNNFVIQEQLMRAIESKSSLKFRFTYENAKVLENTNYNAVFLTEYALWEKDIQKYYDQYNDFYQKVKDATMVKHIIIDGNTDVRVIEYSNGVKICLNYSSEAVRIDGKEIKPLDYIIL